MMPAGSQFAIPTQVVKLIPPYFLDKLARAYGYNTQARTFTPLGHIVALVFTQLAHAFGLNQVRDT